MNEYRKRLMPNVYLTVLPARKFKTGCLSAQFITALDRDRASYNALLPPVLNRGTMRYPDMESLLAAMDLSMAPPSPPPSAKMVSASAWALWPAASTIASPRAVKSCWSPWPSWWASCFWTPSPVAATI